MIESLSRPPYLTAQTVTELLPLDLPVVALTDEGLGNTAWVVRLDDQVVVVDPARDAQPYVAAAASLAAPLTLALETHLHADFISGGRELTAFDAAVVAPAAGELAFAHRGVHADDVINIGRWRVRVLATPGHTPEHVSYLLLDGDQPVAVCTGGSLLAGSFARTDLIAAEQTEALSRALWRSVGQHLLTLPDHVLVLPTHGGGSFCATSGSGQRWSTIGQERANNPLLQVGSEDEFVQQLQAGFGSYPPYFLRLRERNRAGAALLGNPTALPSHDAQALRAFQAQGAVVIDVRAADAYAAAHVQGSLSIVLRPAFASWLGWLVDDPATPLLFVTDEHTDRVELTRQCHGIGYDNLLGELAGGVQAWADAGYAVAQTTLLHTADTSRTIIDVRQDDEFAEGHVPGAVHTELGALPAAAESLREMPMVTMCGHSDRATTAASVLEVAGQHDVAVFVGGPTRWLDSMPSTVRK